MNYDKIILEMLNRIQTLEEKVAALEKEREGETPDKSSVQKEEISKGNKYRALSAYLKNSNLDRVSLSFDKIEEIIGFPLSPSAKNNRENWANSTSISLACSWLKVGYKTVDVNMYTENVVFEKDLY